MNRSIKALFQSVLISLVFLASEVSATDSGEWRLYSEEANGDVYYFDASSVKTKAQLHEVWTRIRYNTSVMGASSYQGLLEIDCSARTERTLQRTFFSDNDWEQPAMSTDMKAKPKRSIRAGSAAERLSDLLCAR